jgi:ethanolaminephosphotransferase
VLLSLTYLGLENQNLMISTVLSLFMAHTGPLLTSLSCVSLLTSQKEAIELLFAANVINLVTFSLFFVYYCAIMILMRYHLFVWSVFAPKFWYLLIYAALSQGYYVLSFLLDYKVAKRVFGDSFQ